MLAILAAAAAAGVYMEVQRHQHPGLSTATASAPAVPASAAATGAEVPPPHLATRSEVKSTLATLEHDVKAGASDAKMPWALAHGLLAFGPHFEADDGRPAVDVIASFAVRKRVDGKTLYDFPEKKGDSLVESHDNLQVKSMLDAGVPLDRKLVTADATQVTLARLVHDMQRTAHVPANDADWHQEAWTLSAWVLDQRLGDKDKLESAVNPAKLRAAALTRLEQDDQVLTDFHGDPTGAFDPGSPLRQAKQKRTGIYGHSCGGLHLVQAVIQSVMQGGDAAQKRRLRKQLGVLLFRYEAERHAYAELLARHPEAGLVLRAQQQKFFGHLLETLGLARSLGAYDTRSEGGRHIDRVMLEAAGDLANTVKELSRGGVYQRLDAIRKQREQTYLDLIGDGCHAIRGLRRTLAVLPR